MIDNSNDEILHLYTEILHVDAEVPNSSQILRGYYSKRILIIVNSNEFGAAEDELLTKMLTACQLKEDDYHLIAVSSLIGLHALISSKAPKIVLLFGINLDTEMVKLNKSLYKPFRFNTIKMLLSDSLTRLNAESSLKSALWTSGLKPLFKV